jgi:hypothetical protein
MEKVRKILPFFLQMCNEVYCFAADDEHAGVNLPEAE